MRRAVTLLVCGGRELDAADVWNWLERFGHQSIAETLGHDFRLTKVIHGGARGADEGADSWGTSEHVKVVAYPADWRKHGKAAGPIRNHRMIEEGKPDLVIAFTGGKGTADMVAKASASGVPVVHAK